MIKPLELILASDDSVVREKAVESLKIVCDSVSKDMLLKEFMPLIKRMKKGDIFSMRISATYLYAHIYKRLDKDKR